MGIGFSHRGSFDKMEKFLNAVSKVDIRKIVDAQAQAGVRALAAATPIDTRLASTSWGYQVRQNGSSCSIIWTNKDVENGFPVVIMLQYGHGTGTGGYVQGRDFINPAIRPVFDQIAETVWKAVSSA